MEEQKQLSEIGLGFSTKPGAKFQVVTEDELVGGDTAKA